MAEIAPPLLRSSSGVTSAFVTVDGHAIGPGGYTVGELVAIEVPVDAGGFATDEPQAAVMSKLRSTKPAAQAFILNNRMSSILSLFATDAQSKICVSSIHGMG